MALGCWEGEGSGARRDREKTGPRLQEEASEGYTGTETKRGLKAAQKNRLHTEGMEKKEESSDAEGQAPGH